MTSLLLASLLFLGIHIFISGTPLRGRLVGMIGEKGYQGLFSVLSLGAIVWMSIAYGRAPYVALWQPPAFAMWLVPLLVFVAMLLVVIGLTTPNPTSAGAEGVLKQEQPVRGIVAVTRHPFLWGVAIWALAHLVANGDLASLLLFGAFLALALIGPHLIDAKRAKRDPEAWARFAAGTSWLPFLAIVQGRAQLSLKEIGWWRPLLAVVIYGLFAGFLHLWLFGVSPHPVY